MRIRAVGGNLQPTVTVTPSTSTQPIKPDPPYNGLSEVIVNPAPLEAATVKSSTTQQPAITPTAPNIGFSSITVEPNLLQTKAVTLPTSQPIRPDSGYYGLSGVNVSAPLYQYDTITPKATSQSFPIPSGNYGLNAVSVAAAPLDTLNVTPTSSSQSFTPTSPYIGYSRVTVGAASGHKNDIFYVDGNNTRTISLSVTGITSVESLYIMGPGYSATRNAYPAVYIFSYNPSLDTDEQCFSFGFNEDRGSDFYTSGQISYSSTTLQIDLDTNAYVFSNKILYFISLVYD